MRDYLVFRMKQKNVARSSMCELLNVSDKTLRNKISGRTDFTWREAQLIRNTYFPEEEYETLFAITA